ncbi:MAG: dihydroorotase [Bernardetiaceae bacterium]
MDTVLLSHVKAVGFGKAPAYCDVRLDLRAGQVAQIAAPSSLPLRDNEQQINGKSLCLTPGWVDFRAAGGLPGQEQRETLQTLCAAATAGGFTHVQVLPDADPPLTQATTARWLQQQTPAPRLLPMAALTEAMTGQNLNNLLELHEAGVRAFGNGNHCLAQSSLVIKALQYLQTCGGLLVQFPQDPLLSAQAQMHEGPTATQLGLPAFAEVAQDWIVRRDLQLLAYAGGRLHFSGISTAGSIAAIRAAKAEGLAVSCDVAAYQAAFLDEDLIDFDTHKKVNPPFRDQTARAAIADGLLDGTIDLIASHHMPWDEESKKLEFDLAAFGILSLQTAAATAWQAWGQTIGIQQFIHKWTTAPRQLLGLPLPQLDVGEPLDFTLFDPEADWTFNATNNHSYAQNSPFLGHTLTGKIEGVFVS